MAKKRRTELDIDSDFLTEEAEEAPPKEDERPAPAPKPAEVKHPRKKINKVKLLIVVSSGTAATALTVALVWLAISFFTSTTASKHAASPPPKQEEAPSVPVAPIYELAPFFIPLKEKGTAEGKLVKIQFALEMTAPETQRDIERNITLVRENVYFMLQSKTGSDFTGKEKLEKIAVDVAIAVNRSLQSGGITRAWITDVLIS